MAGHKITAQEMASGAASGNLGYTPENPSNKNTANGYVGLDANGWAPSTTLGNSPQFTMIASSEDSNGKYKIITYSWSKTGLKYMISTLSGTLDSNGNYPTMTNVYYKSDGATVDHTDTWALTYDSNGTLISTSVVTS